MTHYILKKCSPQIEPPEKQEKLTMIPYSLF